MSKEKLVKYSDLSAPEDERLHLIGTLLLQSESELDAREVKRIGEFIHSYIRRKKALEYCLLEYSTHRIDENLSNELQAEIQWVKSLM